MASRFGPRDTVELAAAADALGISPATMRRRVKDGTIAGVIIRNGGTWIPTSEVERLKAEIAAGRVPRDRRRLRGADRKPNTWRSRPDPYRERVES